jgi:hypothetical protein
MKKPTKQNIQDGVIIFAISAASAAGLVVSATVGSMALVAYGIAFVSIFSVAEEKFKHKNWVRKESSLSTAFCLIAGINVGITGTLISLPSDQLKFLIPPASKTPALSQKFQGASDGVNFDKKTNIVTIQSAARPSLGLSLNS